MPDNPVFWFYHTNKHTCLLSAVSGHAPKAQLLKVAAGVRAGMNDRPVDGQNREVTEPQASERE